MQSRTPKKPATLIVRVPPEVLARVDAIAGREFESRSVVARRALIIGLRRLEREKD